ncbi:MAG: hypothetical protein NTV62_02335 [Candidatus Gribaldobacteria bacterium]|nr:hypothetical protein [Candidatus Gribaldobacteria bacterium]
MGRRKRRKFRIVNYHTFIFDGDNTLGHFIDLKLIQAPDWNDEKRVGEAYLATIFRIIKNPKIRGKIIIFFDRENSFLKANRICGQVEIIFSDYNDADKSLKEIYKIPMKGVLIVTADIKLLKCFKDRSFSAKPPGVIFGDSGFVKRNERYRKHFNYPGYRGHR